MTRIFLIILRVAVALVVLLYAAWFIVLRTPHPDTITYGVSFNTPYAKELGLPWREVYIAILDELQVRHLRLAAHWPMIEPIDDVWNFSEIDEQLQLAKEHGADVVLGVGRRLPRWPECHVPEWAKDMTWEEQQTQIRAYIEAVVTRYKDNPTVVYWQVENEPFLTVFAYEHCGSLDNDFLDEEIALVRSLDPDTPILVTDSGNLGTWFGAYSRGDLFGTSVYVYLYNPETGPFRTVLPPETYVVKKQVMKMLFGKKETMLIELSIEPWLDGSVADVPLTAQLERMPLENFDEILSYARDTRLERQYLWGAEWWYWLKKEHGNSDYWDKAKTIFTPAE
jgi:hypothetical protein